MLVRGSLDPVVDSGPVLVTKSPLAKGLAVLISTGAKERKGQAPQSGMARELQQLVEQLSALVGETFLLVYVYRSRFLAGSDKLCGD